MTSNERISIVTVVKNAAPLLEKTIISVLENRAVQDIDYLIVDGGSTDGTVDVIRKYADHISYWVSVPDSGIYDAMNKGWAVAAPDSFILFLGAGDLLLSLPKSIDTFRINEVVYGTVRTAENRYFMARADFHLKLYNSLHHQALLVNKQLHPEPPFNCRYPVYADFDFNQRLKNRGAEFVFSQDLLSYAQPGGVSDRHNFYESLSIVFANYGFLWAALAFSGYYAMKFFPFLKRLRPFQER